MLWTVCDRNKHYELQKKSRGYLQSEVWHRPTHGHTLIMISCDALHVIVHAIILLATNIREAFRRYLIGGSSEWKYDCLPKLDRIQRVRGKSWRNESAPPRTKPLLLRELKNIKICLFLRHSESLCSIYPLDLLDQNLVYATILFPRS